MVLKRCITPALETAGPDKHPASKTGQILSNYLIILLLKQYFKVSNDIIQRNETNRFKLAKLLDFYYSRKNISYINKKLINIDLPKANDKGYQKRTHELEDRRSLDFGFASRDEIFGIQNTMKVLLNNSDPNNSTSSSSSAITVATTSAKAKANTSVNPNTLNNPITPSSTITSSSSSSLNNLSNDEHTTAANDWFQLSYDTTYEPSTPFHIEIGFIVTSGQQMDEWLRNCFRIAKRLKITMTQIPSKMIFKNTLFHEIPIVIHLPKHIQRKKAVHYLMKHCQFLLYYPTKSFRKQYFHEKGIALVRVRSNGLVWIRNNLNSKSSEEEKLHVKIFKKFQKFITSEIK